MNMYASLLATGEYEGYANNPAKLFAANKWVDHARPIILSMLVLDDEADGPIIRALVDADKGRSPGQPAPWQVIDYREARATIKAAYKALYDMLDGIRDSFISDERVGLQDDDGQQEEADAFNDWLSDEVVKVDAAVDAIARERGL